VLTNFRIVSRRALKIFKTKGGGASHSRNTTVLVQTNDGARHEGAVHRYHVAAAGVRRFNRCADGKSQECEQNPFHDFTSDGSKHAVLFGSAGLPSFVRTSCGAVK
jgi:hypothetical protein